MSFKGFTQRDFDIFDLPDFSSRMPTLKAEITPKLKLLAEVIAPQLPEVTGHPMHIHVAAHLRRTVNAPEETWAAYAREKRAYKPYVHFRTAINGGGIKITCFLEDYARDKPSFAANLATNSVKLATYLKEHPEILSYDMMDPYGKPLAGRSLDKKALKAFAGRLKTVKSQHASFGIYIPKSNPTVGDSKALSEMIVQNISDLMPIYRIGLP